MPQVPTYQGPQVRSAPLPGPMQDAGALTAPQRAMQGLGQTVSNLGVVADQHYERQLETQSQIAAHNADSQITADWLEWDAQARQKYRGENVGEYATEAKKWWDTASAEYGKNLDQRTRDKVGPTLARKRTTAIGGVLEFSNRETERHADDVYAANAATNIQFGVGTGDVAGAAAQVRRGAAELGARKGWTTAQVQAEQFNQLSNLHLAQISKLATNNADAADAYYKANYKEVAFGAQPKVEAVLKGEMDNQFAQQRAAELAGRPLAEQLTEAAKIGDPQRREKTITRIKEVVGLKELANREREKQFGDQAWQLVGQSKKVPEAVLVNMDGRERVQLQEFLRQRAERLAGSGGVATVKTDPRMLAKIYDLMRDDPEGFKKLRMEPLMNSLGASDMEQIARVQRDMLKPSSADAAKEVATAVQQIGTYVVGLNPEKKAALNSAAFDALAEHQRVKGKPPTYEERKVILDRLVMDGEVVNGSWYKADPNKKYFEATPEERKRFIPVITGEDRGAIVAALKGEGVAKPTDEQIVARFKLAKGMR